MPGRSPLAVPQSQHSPARKLANDTAFEARRKTSVDAVLKSRGEPLDWSVRGPAERQFHHDFSDVRVHTGSSADAAARSLHAKAFTHGSHIAFTAGRFQTTDPDGHGLLTHELAHVVQQSRGGVSESSRLEDGARQATVASLRGASSVYVPGASAPRISCEGEDETPLWKRAWSGAKRAAGGAVERVKAAPSEIKQAVVEKYDEAKQTARSATHAVETRVEAVKAEVSAKLTTLRTPEGRAKVARAIERATKPTIVLSEKSAEARRGAEARLTAAEKEGKGLGRARAFNTLVKDVDDFVQAWNRTEVEPTRAAAAAYAEGGGWSAAIRAGQKKADEGMKDMTTAFKKTVSDYEDGTIIPPASDTTLIDPQKHPTLAAIEHKADAAGGAVAGFGRQAQGGVAMALWSMGTGIGNISVHPVNTIRGLGELPGSGPLQAAGQTVGAIDDLITSDKPASQVLSEYALKQGPSGRKDEAEKTKNLLKGLGENYIEAAGYKLDAKTREIVPSGEKARWGRIPGLLLVDVGSFFIPGGSGTKAGAGAKALESARTLEALGTAEKGIQIGSDLAKTGDLAKGADVVAEGTKLADVGAEAPKATTVAKEGQGAEAVKAATEAKAAQGAAKPRRVPFLDDAMDRVKKLFGESKPANDVTPPKPEPPASAAAGDAPKSNLVDLPADRPRDPVTHAYKEGSPPVQDIGDAKRAASPKQEAAKVAEALDADKAATEAELASQEHAQQAVADAKAEAPELAMTGTDSPVGMAGPNKPPTKTPPARPTQASAPLQRGMSGKPAPPIVQKIPTRKPPRTFTAQPKEGPKLPPGTEDAFESGRVHQERKFPGGLAEKDVTLAGRFVDKWWPQLAEMMGVDPKRLFVQGAEELFPGGAARNEVLREFPVPHPDYPSNFKPRTDVIDPHTGRVIEIGPGGPGRTNPVKFVEAQQYAEWLDRYFPRTDGLKHTPAYALYHQQLVLDWLRHIGYLERPRMMRFNLLP
jgi:Domain of unknown function (DUF4157)